VIAFVRATSAAAVSEHVLWPDAYIEYTPEAVFWHWILPNDDPNFALHSSDCIKLLIIAMWSSQSPCPRMFSNGTAAFASQ